MIQIKKNTKKTASAAKSGSSNRHGGKDAWRWNSRPQAADAIGGLEKKWASKMQADDPSTLSLSMQAVCIETTAAPELPRLPLLDQTIPRAWRERRLCHLLVVWVLRAWWRKAFSSSSGKRINSQYPARRPKLSILEKGSRKFNPICFQARTRCASSWMCIPGLLFGSCNMISVFRLNRCPTLFKESRSLSSSPSGGPSR